jgi:outer membrane receptor protein involved in Fe transport
MTRGYETTYSVRPTGLNGLFRCGRFIHAPGIMRRYPRRPGNHLLTWKSKSVGFSWDPTDLRAIFGSFSRAHGTPDPHESETRFESLP